MEILSEPGSPTGFARLLYRLPIQFYRIGLGGLLGGRFLRLTHTGRVSGKPREVVIEVVGREDDAYYVCSGFGKRSQWYRNVVHTPEVTIQVGTRKTAARAVTLDAEEGARIMAHYAEQHPKAARKLCGIMGFAVDGGMADYREVGRTVPFLRMEPRSSAAAE